MKFLLGIYFCLLGAHMATAESFLEAHPILKQYIFTEPKSNFHFGIGLSPIGVVNTKVFLSASVFQIHYIRDPWDIELLSVGIGYAFPKQSHVESRHFTLRISPKLALVQFLSIGPLLGYEFVSFPDIGARIKKDIDGKPMAGPFEPFSSAGFLFGLQASQTFQYGGDLLIRVSENFYKETYSTQQTFNDWNYDFEQADLQSDRSIINASWVFAIEFSVLF